MRRFLLAMIVASSALYATSMASSSCTVAKTTVSPCPGNLNLSTGLSGPNYFVSAFAEASDSAPPPPAANITPPTLFGPLGGTMFAIGEAEATYMGGEPPPFPSVLAANGDASANIVAHTAGPARVGLIEFSMNTATLHDDLGMSISITDGVHSYDIGSGAPPGGCFFGGCRYTATLPFDLGANFRVSISADAGVSISPPAPGGPEGAGRDALGGLSFQLLEANGGKIPFSLVPEPSSWTLLLLGFGAGTFLLLRKRHSA